MRFEDWGLISYQEATNRQLELVEKVAFGFEDDTVVFCSHPPVVTLGRATEPSDLAGWSGEVVETSRGGRATYHGPEQLVIYPIIDLKKERQNLRSRDVDQYLRTLELMLIQTLEKLDIQAKCPKIPDVLLTGVWVRDKKIASIGIAVRKWVTYHGAALNLSLSDDAFSGIAPCGFTTGIMTSVRDILNRDIDRSLLIQILTESAELHFS